MAEAPCLYYKQIRSVKAGQIERFSVSYDPQPTFKPSQSLWLRVRNTHLVALRAAYLAGPYVLYVDCVSEDYDPHKQCFVSADQPLFAPQVSPGQSFCTELSCHTIKDKYHWTIDVVSQIIFNTNIDVEFEISISSTPISSDTDWSSVSILPSAVTVGIHDTLDLWNLPFPDTTKPIHLVILTHGLHSNVSTDMLYLKEQIERYGRQSGDNVIVRGYFGNAGKTERGVKYLGSRVAEYVVLLVLPQGPLEGQVDRISFVGHSLGGLVQLFAIAYIHVNFPWFFARIQPTNFIALASPFLGVVHENPVYVKLALLAGIVGITGQDLGLKHVEHDSQPLLLLLPTGPTHTILQRFARRTIYANAVNDGIVPLRTASLLYLDYRGLSKILGGSGSGSNRLTLPTNTAQELPQKTNSEADHNLPGPCATSKENTYTAVPGKPGSSPEVKQRIAKVPALLLLVLSPVKAVRSLFAPQKQAAGASDAATCDYGRYQAGGSDDPAALEYGMLPRLSVLQSATSLLLPPLPPLKYICDPAAREDVIVHDKVYQDADIPAPLVPVKTFSAKARLRLLEAIDYNIEHLEERIAREYHTGMAWRKVIVRLEADAHNNIIVRRRFSNAYGWPVIDHLVKEHFTASTNIDRHELLSPATASADVIGGDGDGDMAPDLDLERLVARDVIARDNDTIERQQSSEDNLPEHIRWMKATAHAELLFALGPTGLLSEVSAIVGKAKDQWDNHGIAGVWGMWPLDSTGDALGSALATAYAEPLPPETTTMDSQVMGDFI